MPRLIYTDLLFVHELVGLVTSGFPWQTEKMFLATA